MNARDDGKARMKAIALAAGAVPLVMALAAATAGPVHRLKSGESWRPRATINAPGVNGAILLQGRVSDSRMGPARIRGAYRAVETAGNGVLRNVHIDGLEATNLQRDGIRLRGSVDGVTISNFTLRMRSAPQARPHLPEGIAIMSGRNITIRDGRISGFRLRGAKGRYPNGDGIAAERGVSSLRIERVEANDNSDAGFDLKSRSTRLNALTARRNYRNYRFWGDVTAGTLMSVDPRDAHVWAGKGAVVRIDRLIARSSGKAPLLRVEGAREIVIGRCELNLPKGTPIVAGARGGARIRLGVGCRT